MTNPDDKRSPLKAPPLRQAGQSLDEEIERQIDDNILVYAIWASVLVFLAAWEWWRHLSANPPDPWLYTGLAVVGVLISVWKITNARRKVRALKLGREGEQFVGQLLEELRARAFNVFHDIPGDRFNIDHVIVGPKGIYTIETKTLSKPVRGESRVTFDGEQILANGFKPDRDPVVQAIAQASWLQEQLFVSTGRKFHVRPVVIYLGWFVEKTGGAKSDVWVLNEKALPPFIEREREVLTREDVYLVSDRIAIYVRSKNL